LKTSLFYLLYERPLLAIPKDFVITLYQPDGETEIDVGDSADYLNEYSRKNPLVVKVFVTSSQPTSTALKPVLQRDLLFLIKEGNDDYQTPKIWLILLVMILCTDSFAVLADCLQKRHVFWKERKTDRNLHPILFLLTVQALGSKFLQELPSSFINFVIQGTYSQ
jgi:hypothetical protein